jgi:predicted GIY-YIG superfamily endonuclease
MSQEGTCNWRGRSGKIYTFEVWTKGTPFNEAECVYIYTKFVNGSWQCIYVGQTSRLATRLDQHASGTDASDRCIQRSGATHIHILRLEPESVRLDAETDLRSAAYNWSCNMQ